MRILIQNGTCVTAADTFAADVWTTWVPLGAGAAVTSLVLGSTFIYGRWRGRRLSEGSREEDLPWEALLSLLERRVRGQAAGPPGRQATEEEVGQVLASLPAVGEPQPLERPADREFRLAGRGERPGSKVTLEGARL